MAKKRRRKTAQAKSRKAPTRPRRRAQAREAGGPTEHAGIITIRKYANRRLYDTAASAHITQEDLYRMVGRGAMVRVIDASSGEDITSQALALTLIEHDPAKWRLMPAWLLHQMIRLREQALGGWLGPLWAMLGAAGHAPAGQPTWPGAAAVPFAWPAGGPVWPAAGEVPWGVRAPEAAATHGRRATPTSERREVEVAEIRAEIEALLQRLGEMEAGERRLPPA